MQPKRTLNYQNSFAELPNQFYQPLTGQANTKPKVVHYNPSALSLLGVDDNHHSLNGWLESEFGFVKTHKQQAPLAMAYSGHQFGVWAGQLGDGRAVLLGQIEHLNRSWDIHLKGSGQTAYSRMGDGKAVMRSSIREYLAGEHLHALGIPSSRSACLFDTNEMVYRDFKAEKGAMLVRLAESFIRFGHFEHFSYAKDFDNLETLTHYVINNYFEKNLDYASWLQEVVKRTAELIANWQSYGFCHGVMNTDNMSIVGLTIDYGPYGFMESFQPNYVCNQSDHTGYYAFNKQPAIALWNLQALAYALKPIIDETTSQEIISSYADIFKKSFSLKMCQKIGFTQQSKEVNTCWQNLLEIMAKQRVDFSLCFRYLSNSVECPNQWLNLFNQTKEARQWLQGYHGLLTEADWAERINRKSPKFVLRNWVAEYAIRKTEKTDDFTALDKLLKILQRPFEEHDHQPSLQKFAKPAPMDYRNITVSCSS